ncbi:hypothetical protein I79_001668 [Cricetulus griseus]|uniref:Uncharacterized protein n=1 Tax=Cricetulus griseus TaxID=10029 RepID=G3GVD2_CRIGR|nr:hypothetical protein I79_001668 [Cricetulus griseus]
MWFLELASGCVSCCLRQAVPGSWSLGGLGASDLALGTVLGKQIPRPQEMCLCLAPCCSSSSVYTWSAAPSPAFSSISCLRESSILYRAQGAPSQRDPSICRLIPGDTHPTPRALTFTDLMQFLRAMSLSYLFWALQAMGPLPRFQRAD